MPNYSRRARELHVRELMDIVEAATGSSEADGLLDDLIHDLLSQHASEINNEGIESQLGFLVEELGRQEAGVALDRRLAEARKDHEQKV